MFTVSAGGAFLGEPPLSNLAMSLRPPSKPCQGRTRTASGGGDAAPGLSVTEHVQDCVVALRRGRR